VLAGNVRAGRSFTHDLDFESLAMVEIRPPRRRSE
jgi:hypothetical protein